MVDPKIDNEVKRYPSRASYDENDLIKVLNSSYICSVSFSIDDVSYVDPMVYVNEGTDIYIHCSPESRIHSILKSGKIITVSVLNIDGIVLHSMVINNSINYRSAIIYGKARQISDSFEKFRIFKLLTDRIMPGRWEDSIKPTETDLEGVSVFRIYTLSFSVKKREGFSMEYSKNNIWEGYIPVQRKFGLPVGKEGCDLPSYIKNSQ